ncbi:protein-tyrosine-phosphatase [Rhizocola hellebori]|uniref:Protein-tyrosine-phosphatase n=1 Tax=Rhizocola hellebori TaxID=1392758 RepID=A0A8J3QHV9_9ACTN|nr:protein-tyrosine-phosphatase [Rhizocola hellebori]
MRDLGGLPTASGGRIREGALIRADSLTRLTEDGVAQVKAAGVRRIVDLRNVDEATDHPFASELDLYRLAPLIDPAREPDRNKSAERSLADIYCSSLERNTRSIVEGVTAIADAPDGTVVVHCAVGKDRTGMMVALVLSVAGVPDEVIAEDYALSTECLRADHEEILASITDEALRRKAVERMSSRPETMTTLLSFVRQRWGGVAEYLQAHGITADQLSRLHARLVE